MTNSESWYVRRARALLRLAGQRYLGRPDEPPTKLNYIRGAWRKPFDAERAQGVLKGNTDADLVYHHRRLTRRVTSNG